MAEAKNEAAEGGDAAAAAAAPGATTTEEDRLNGNPLAKALNSLFVSVTDVIQGELQSSNVDYELLRDMNLRTATEYNNFADFASGLRVFVERLKDKNELFNRYLEEIDGIDHEVTELEALVSTLDNYSNTLHAQLTAALKRRKEQPGHRS